MRRVRTLVAGTALGFAALTLAVPAAHADSHGSGPAAGSSDSSSPDKSWSGGESGKWEENKKPHGGPHAGIGALDDNAGLAAGGVLVAGGLGLAAYAVRRRPVVGGARA
ncbi:hypothetical protein LO772_28850 [Yinghuangia sp. ASG 101]|uniref:hypothetical protein n=1 Tax=Yinghuangia sp. ASG 101 TaxID=2896848 RepID=UPI001E3AD6AE|nr:hypothetical protein [Yinghuangia sp. ASG 101]UGQ10790.1 hypothetical protein LO772_28850 [Yinghuangia sp. ASG 101]